MPELPEVEVVRRGLENHPRRHGIKAVTALHPRSVRSHSAGPEGPVSDLANRGVDVVTCRGKYLQLVLGGDAMVARLGMNGQFRMNRPQDPQPCNAWVLFDLDGDIQLRLADQYMFGGLKFVRGGGGRPVPYIVLDPFNLDFDPAAVVYRMQTRRTMVKRAILDQGLISGVGNIYADESLWRVELYFDHPTQHLAQARAVVLLERAHDVMSEALAADGTSFDSLYVNVNDESGYFECGLDAYGREDQPCRRCATPVVCR